MGRDDLYLGIFTQSSQICTFHNDAMLLTSKLDLTQPPRLQSMDYIACNTVTCTTMHNLAVIVHSTEAEFDSLKKSLMTSKLQSISLVSQRCIVQNAITIFDCQLILSRTCSILTSRYIVPSHPWGFEDIWRLFRPHQSIKQYFQSNSNIGTDSSHSVRAWSSTIGRISSNISCKPFSTRDSDFSKSHLQGKLLWLTVCQAQTSWSLSSHLGPLWHVGI